MTTVAPPTRFFQRLHRFLRSDNATERVLAAAGTDEVNVTSPPVPTVELSAPTQDTNIPAPAHITVFEVAGTPASPGCRR